MLYRGKVCFCTHVKSQIGSLSFGSSVKIETYLRTKIYQGVEWRRKLEAAKETPYAVVVKGFVSGGGFGIEEYVEFGVELVADERTDIPESIYVGVGALDFCIETDWNGERQFQILNYGITHVDSASERIFVIGLNSVVFVIAKVVIVRKMADCVLKFALMFGKNGE